MYKAIMSLSSGTHAKGYCEFPELLHRPHQSTPGISRRLWLSRTAYHNNTGSWTKQLEMTAKPREIIVKSVEKTMCQNHGTNHSGECLEKEEKLQWICISEELDGKYRVQVKRDK